MIIKISGSDEIKSDVSRRIMQMLNSEFDLDVIMHDKTSSRMPHAIEKGFATIYVSDN